MVAGKWAGVEQVGKNSLPVGTVKDIIIFYSELIVACKSWGIEHCFRLGAEKQNGMYFCNCY